MNVMMHSKMLFVDEETTSPMKFFIRPSAEKTKIRPLIEHGGGVIVPKFTTDTIRLIEPGARVLTPDDNTISTKYILDCVEKNTLLDKEPYRMQIKSFNDSDIAGLEDAFEVRTSEKQLKASRPYASYEDQKIVDYIIKTKRYCEVKGRRFWTTMADSGTMEGRTWQSLRDRFLKKIAPNLKKFNLTENQMNYFNLTLGYPTDSELKARKKDSNKFFTKPEDSAILRFIFDHFDHEDITGDDMWKRMEARDITTHTWQSMKDRFFKGIVPNISRYNVPKLELKRLATVIDLPRSVTHGDDGAESSPRDEDNDKIETSEESSNNTAFLEKDMYCTDSEHKPSKSNFQQAEGDIYNKLYAVREDWAILRFIFSHFVHEDITGNDMWKRMEARGVTAHPWDSMKDHFFKEVVPNIGRYHLPKSELKRLATVIDLPTSVTSRSMVVENSFEEARDNANTAHAQKDMEVSNQNSGSGNSNQGASFQKGIDGFTDKTAAPAQEEREDSNDNNTDEEKPIDGKPYTEAEITDMLKFVFENFLHEDITEDLLWKKMASMEGVSHSWKSLKKTFFTRVVPNMHTYNSQLGSLANKLSVPDVPPAPSVSSPNRNEVTNSLENHFSDRESWAILQCILTRFDYAENQPIADFIWKKMETSKMIPYTWQSMKYHFFNHIVPNIHQYNLSREQMKRLASLANIPSILASTGTKDLASLDVSSVNGKGSTTDGFEGDSSQGDSPVQLRCLRSSLGAKLSASSSPKTKTIDETLDCLDRALLKKANANTAILDIFKKRMKSALMSYKDKQPATSSSTNENKPHQGFPPQTVNLDKSNPNHMTLRASKRKRNFMQNDFESSESDLTPEKRTPPRTKGGSLEAKTIPVRASSRKRNHNSSGSMAGEISLNDTPLKSSSSEDGSPKKLATKRKKTVLSLDSLNSSVAGSTPEKISVQSTPPSDNLSDSCVVETPTPLRASKRKAASARVDLITKLSSVAPSKESIAEGTKKDTATVKVLEHSKDLAAACATFDISKCKFVPASKSHGVSPSESNPPETRTLRFKRTVTNCGSHNRKDCSSESEISTRNPPKTNIPEDNSVTESSLSDTSDERCTTEQVSKALETSPVDASAETENCNQEAFTANGIDFALTSDDDHAVQENSNCVFSNSILLMETVKAGVGELSANIEEWLGGRTEKQMKKCHEKLENLRKVMDRALLAARVERLIDNSKNGMTAEQRFALMEVLKIAD